TALCDGPQALVNGDLRALASAVRQLPPLLGRRPAADAIRVAETTG
ncbi:MAG TPA: 3-deoxy-7-phosphoheptulonate synthase, partial [Candidatus Limnocylindria bacterium]|nr:3-deoxy-7-phosphoheptulonate synthase [Candidatus Limnocylindria bacterium]